MLNRLFAALVILGLSACASARGPELVLPRMSHATETVDIDIGPLRLGLAGWILGKSDDPDSVALRETLKACKSVHIRSYEFASDFEYPEAEIDAIRMQLSRPGWTQLATVRERKTRENVDVYIAFHQEKITGLVVLASGPRDLTIVNVVGSFDPAQLQRLHTHFSEQARHKSAWHTSRDSDPDPDPDL
jgi:hypothetical protein